MIDSSQYHARQISDHSPLTIDVRMGATRGNNLWKLNPFWLTLLPDPDPLPIALISFFKQNVGSTSIDTVWEAAKAFLCGQVIKEILYIKTNTKKWENQLITDAQSSETLFIANPTDDTRRTWLASQSMLKQLSLQLAENKSFFCSRNTFKRGKTQVICWLY